MLSDGMLELLTLVLDKISLVIRVIHNNNARIQEFETERFP